MNFHRIVNGRQAANWLYLCKHQCRILSRWFFLHVVPSPTAVASGTRPHQLFSPLRVPAHDLADSLCRHRCSYPDNAGGTYAYLRYLICCRDVLRVGVPETARAVHAYRVGRRVFPAHRCRENGCVRAITIVLPGAPVMHLLQHSAGDTCANGLPGFDASGVCCPESCGQCGGVGCSSLGEGCCTSGVIDSGVMCSDSLAAPCIMDGDIDGKWFVRRSIFSQTPL